MPHSALKCLLPKDWWALAVNHAVHKIAGSSCAGKAVVRLLAAALFLQGKFGFPGTGYGAQSVATMSTTHGHGSMLLPRPPVARNPDQGCRRLFACLGSSPQTARQTWLFCLQHDTGSLHCNSVQFLRMGSSTSSPCLHCRHGMACSPCHGEAGELWRATNGLWQGDSDLSALARVLP